MRHPDRAARRGQSSVSPPPDWKGLDPSVLVAAHEATRALLAAATPREVVDVVFALVDSLGAAVIPASAAGPDALPLDLSFGVQEPMLARADPAGVPRMHLEVLLPTFLEDARRAVLKLRHTAQLLDEAVTDQLTGLLNRRAWDRQVHRLRPGDTIAVLVLDRFGELTKTAGEPAGEEVLASFGRLLRDHLPPDDLAARYRGHHLLVGALDVGRQRLAQRLEPLGRVWGAVRPYPVTYSVAVAPVTTTPALAVAAAYDSLTPARPGGDEPSQTIA